DAMADDLVADGDQRSARQRLRRWGAENPKGARMRGVQDLLERLRERNQQQMNRYRLDSLMDDLQKRLEQVVQTERTGIQTRLEQTRSPGQELSPTDPSDAASQKSDPSNKEGQDNAHESS